MRSLAGLEKALQDAKAWLAAETGAQVAARVRVDPRMRRAEARKLFLQEEGDHRLRFEFTVTFAADSEILGRPKTGFARPPAR
jgi:hypothetical protein